TPTPCARPRRALAPASRLGQTAVADGPARQNVTAAGGGQGGRPREAVPAWLSCSGGVFRFVIRCALDHGSGGAGGRPQAPRHVHRLDGRARPASPPSGGWKERGGRGPG